MTTQKKTSEFIKFLGRYRDELTSQQLHTLKGQALAGDISGALKGLNKILNREDEEGGPAIQQGAGHRDR